MGSVPLITAWMYWPAAFLAMVGCAILCFALFGGRSQLPRCAGCWYDMTGSAVPPVRCPECGRLARTERELHRPRRRWPLVPVALLAIAPLGVVFGVLHGDAAYCAIMPRWKLVKEQRHGPLAIRRYAPRDPRDWADRTDVCAGGRTLATGSVGVFDRLTFLDADDDGCQELMAILEDARKVGTFRFSFVCARNGEAAVVADMHVPVGVGTERPQGGTETIFWFIDDSFERWNTPRHQMTASVAYRFKDGAFRVALDRMALRAHEIEARSRAVAFEHSRNQIVPSSSYWMTTLQLMHCSGEEKAGAFFDSAWGATEEEKKGF
ncbi:MAG TPA: hypothetical protein VEB22_10160, partial [Phycisphaerales bacterium]|nr:hypothetical protein [Phycisphaerales bacterium]